MFQKVLQYASLVAMVAVAYMTLDIVWLGFLMKDFYQTQISVLLMGNENTYSLNWVLTLVIWGLVSLGQVFLVRPNGKESLFYAILYGGLYGLIVYGVFDLTNQSMIAKWPVALSIVDIFWGVTLNSIIGGGMYTVENIISRSLQEETH